MLQSYLFFFLTLLTPDRPMCRYDVVLEENKEVTFKPIPCDESNF